VRSGAVSENWKLENRKWKVGRRTRLFPSVSLEFPQPCRANIAVDELHHRHRSKIVLLVFIRRYVTSIQSSGQMIPKLIDRASALAAELNVLLVGEPPVTFCQVCGHRYGRPAHLGTQLERFLLRKSSTHAVNTCSEDPCRPPGNQVSKVADSRVDRQRIVGSCNFHFLFSIFQSLK